MVNNESEIIESFVRYNYNFVDEMVIIDNGCTDSTIKIIRNLIAEGFKITVYDESLEAYNQYRLDNKYLNKIINEIKPDWILPLDADEFLTGENNPREVIEKLPMDNIYYVTWRWYVMTKNDNEKEAFIPKKMQYCLIRPAWNYSDGTPVTKAIIPAAYYKKMGLTLSMGHHTVFGNDKVRRMKINKWVMGISAVLLIASNSRGALIMTFVFLVVSHYDALLKLKASQRGIFVFVVSIVGVIGAALVYSFIISDSGSYMIRMKGFITYIELYKADFFHMWYGNAEMAWKDGNYVNNVRAVIGWDGTVELSFLSILVKNGILGYFGYAIIFLFYIKNGLTVKNWKKKSIILALSLSLLSSAFVENYITNTHVVYGIFNYCVINGLIGQNNQFYKRKKENVRINQY